MVSPDARGGTGARDGGVIDDPGVSHHIGGNPWSHPRQRAGSGIRVSTVRGLRRSADAPGAEKEHGLDRWVRGNAVAVWLPPAGSLWAGSWLVWHLRPAQAWGLTWETDRAVATSGLCQ